jgi:hypothetical protein
VRYDIASTAAFRTPAVGPDLSRGIAFGALDPRTPIGFPYQQEWCDMLKKSLFALAAAGLALTALPMTTPADAAVGVQAGVLTCNVASGSGFIFGSDRNLSCTYSGNGNRIEHYTGTISKFGVDIGYTRGGVIMWAVLAPTHNPPPDALTGDYGGVTAGASVGVGGSANLLVGGSGHEISLQPLSVEGQKGLNVAAGIAEIKLRPAG